MSTFAVLLLCIQAFLVQNALGQYLGGCGCRYAGPAIDIAPAIDIRSACGGALSLGPFGGAIGGTIVPEASYGGTGEGNVAVTGELPVAGNTAVAGQVPIMGAVSFNGAVPAAGAVSISGQCACGCSSPIHY